MAPLIDTTQTFDNGDNSTSPFSEEKSAPLHAQYPASKRRMISFSFNVQVQEILSIKDYSVEEIKNAWYSLYELRQVKDDARAIVSKMAKGESDPENGEWTSRGLKSRTRAGNKEKFQNRRNSKAAVFMEQDEQEENGIYDPELLADIYHEHTEYCQFVASAIGSRDAKEAKDWHPKMSTIEIGRLALNVQSSTILPSSAA